MSDGGGYWIDMNAGDTLVVGGNVIVSSSTPPAYPLVQGWNLVGFKPEPSVQSESVSQYLSSITGQYAANNVWVYTSGGWVRAEPNYMLEPGEAIWVQMTTPATLRP